MANRCSCSEVWLEKRSEQHAVRPSLFIKEEMMLQPQPHIDLLISSLALLGLEDVWKRETSSKPQPLPGPCRIPSVVLTADAFSVTIPHSADPQVLCH